MDREKKRTLFFGIILGLIAVASIIYFLWGSFINRGTIHITGDAPFVVEVFGGETYTCEISPCKITQKIGIKNLIMAKEGCKTFVQEVKVGLWQTTNLEVKFEIIPHLEETDIIPVPDKEFNYSIIFDNENRLYKLINLQDDQQRAIVYFQKEIPSPKIFGSEEMALIIDNSTQPYAYKVDIVTKTREKISDPTIQNITSGSWSDNGKYFVFSRENSDYLWLLNPENSIKQLLLRREDSKYAWTYSGSLLFITQQKAQPQSRTGKYGNDYIELLDEKSTFGFRFGEYHPDEDSYTEMETFSQIETLPEILIPASNGQTVYFQVGEQKYKLLLK